MAQPLGSRPRRPPQPDLAWQRSAVRVARRSRPQELPRAARRDCGSSARPLPQLLPEAITTTCRSRHRSPTSRCAAERPLRAALSTAASAGAGTGRLQEDVQRREARAKPKAGQGSERSRRPDSNRDPFITSVDRMPSLVAPGRAKSHGSNKSNRPRWRPKTSDGKGVDPA
jgi:hypothetical protein